MEGYSPTVLRKAVRQAGKAASFRDASDDLKELAGVKMCPSHLSTIAERIGREWADRRDADVEAFRDNTLTAECVPTASVATVMVDGGRVQTRQESEEPGPGVCQAGWQEVKVACCQSMSSKVHAVDPQPDPPSKFLDPVEVTRLSAEIKARAGATKPPPTQASAASESRRSKKKRKKKRKGPQKLVRTVVASMANSEAFGWQMAAEVQRRGLDKASRKGYVCDGQKYNWTLFELHLLPLGFVGILDVLHLLAYLYGAAQAVAGKGSVEAWKTYERWLRWAWSGRVRELLKALRAGCVELGAPPKNCSDTDPRKVVSEARSYVENNQSRMNYPQYRCLGLPISSAPVESVMKQVNRRMKGTEKFWLQGGAEAILQVRAAYLSEDGRTERYWTRPRPYAPAVGSGRLGRAA
jgi:hypothetical protein